MQFPSNFLTQCLQNVHQIFHFQFFYVAEIPGLYILEISERYWSGPMPSTNSVRAPQALSEVCLRLSIQNIEPRT